MDCGMASSCQLWNFAASGCTVQPMRTLLYGLCLLALLVVPCAAQNSKQDGAWWRDLSDGERAQFLAGFIDCYANDLGDKNNTFPESWDDYAARISKYYDSHPQQLARPVTSVLFDVRSKHPPKPLEGGEVWTEKHWFFNGGYWGEMRRYDQIAFVDGYVSCYRTHLSSHPMRFSKPSSVYAAQISRWFDAEPSKTSKLVAKREKTAIADVLYKFTDQRLRIPADVAEGMLCGSADLSSPRNDDHSDQANSLCGPTLPPLYPPEAKKQGIQGTVKLRAVIGTDGLIKDVKVIDGHPMLTSSAVEAVRRWKYRPYLVNGKPVEVETSILVNFTLAKAN